MDENVNFALDYFELGEVYRAIALKGGATGRKDWRAALDNFEASKGIVASIPSPAFDDPNDREKLAELPGRIAECLQHSGDEEARR